MDMASRKTGGYEPAPILVDDIGIEGVHSHSLRDPAP
jgi:hypothetical protein